MENKESGSSSNFTEEDELFDYIINQKENNINIFLSKKKYPIYEYRNKDGKNSSVLHISVYKKNYNIVKILIDYIKLNYPDKLIQFINTKNDKGIYPIHYASFRGSIDIIKLLIENGADITKKTEKNLSIIHYCAQGNMPSSLIYFYLKFRNENKSLLKKDKYKLIFDEDGAGSTILHWAVYSLAEDFILYLINLDIFDTEQDKINFINKQDRQGYTALHLCTTSNSSRLALKLLQNNADTALKDKNGRTPLDLAINKGQDDIREILESSQKCQLCRFKAPLKQIKRNNKNIVFIFVIQFIECLILFFSTFPIIFYKYDNHYINILFYIFIFFLLLFFIFYILLLVIDPGVKSKRNVEDLNNLLLNNKLDLTKYCYKCYVLKTKSSKHCIICDCCYDNFDHHCYWINKCVAKNNFIWFIIFLFETSLYLVTAFLISILGLININVFNLEDFDTKNFCNKYLLFKSLNSDEPCYSIYNDKFVLHLVLNIILSLSILLFLIPECFIFFLHINVILSNYREEKKNKNDKLRITTAPLINENEESFYISSKNN